MKKLHPLFLLATFLCLSSGCGGGSSAPPPILLTATHLSVTASSSAPVAGTPFSVTVNALDASNNVVSTYSGTVQLTTSDPQAVIQVSSLTVASGTGTVSVTFKTAGAQTITVVDAAKLLTAGSSSPLGVMPAAASQFSISVPSAATAGLPITVTVSALDSFSNVAIGYSGTVHLSSTTDNNAVFPNDTKLTNGVGAFFPVTLKTIGNQTVTATDTVTHSTTGISSPINVVSNAATHLAFTSFPATVNARTTFQFVVNALDAANNVASGYSGTVKFSSTDSNARRPANTSLIAGSIGVSATMETPGNQTLTASDVAVASITGSSPISVTAVPALTITSSSPPSGTVGVSYGGTRTVDYICRVYGPPARVNCTPCLPSFNCRALPRCPGRLPCFETRVVFTGFTFTAAGGIQPYSWSATGMPPGLSVNPGNGQISGTPTMANTTPYNVIVSVTDSGSPAAAPVSSNYSITISLPPPPVISTTPLPSNGVLNQPYSFTFSATGAHPFTWSATGALPAGLSPVTSAGVLAGTPTQTGTFSITVTAADQYKQASAPTKFDIVVNQHGFVPTGSTATARRFHSATLLANGKVLVAGGSDCCQTVFASAELYDPATGTFSPTGSMTVPRAGHTATLLNNGKVLVAGGSSIVGGAALSSAELYDPATGTFTATGSMATARVFHTTTALAPADGRVLVTGGDSSFFNGSTAASLAGAELFDPKTGTFTAVGNMTAAREAHTATLLNDGRVLIAGGSQGTVGYSATSIVLGTSELFDPTKGTFAAAGSMGALRELHTATLLKTGKVLVAGGLNSSVLGTAELFDPVSGSFMPTTGTMTASRFYQDATLLADGRVLLTGGSDGNNRSLASAELFDPAAATFAVTGNMNAPRVWHTATLLLNGTVLVTDGADTNSAPMAAAELYK